ncbi:MAG: DUF3006 family protein [Clostridia bacterium]|nr:DUF3006 family protein [Clostridia bacterium]
MKIRYSVDRAEGDILVLLPDDDSHAVLKLSRTAYPYSVNDVLDIELDGEGKVLSVTRCESERDERLKKNKARLDMLFNRGKK